MIRIAECRIVPGVLRRAQSQSARHSHDVHDANFLPWIARRLPFRNRRRLFERVHAQLDQAADQCSGEALAHGPAFERGVDADARCIPLTDDAAFVGDDEGERHRAVRRKRLVHRAGHQCRVDVRRPRRVRQHITHRPRRGRRWRQIRAHDARRERHRVGADGQRDATLTAVSPGNACHAAPECQAHCLRRSVDHGVFHLGAILQRSREKSHVRCRIGRCQPGDEHGAAQRGREARRVVRQRVARRRRPCTGQLQRFAARNNAGCRRLNRRGGSASRDRLCVDRRTERRQGDERETQLTEAHGDRRLGGNAWQHSGGRG